MRKILLYGVGEETLQAIKMTGQIWNIRVIRITDGQLADTLAGLFEAETDFSGTCDAFEDEYMLIQDMSREELIGLIRALKKQGVEFEGIKVMRTPSNENWKLEDLFRETAEEHQVVKKVRLLQQILQSCGTLDLSQYPDEGRELKQAVRNAYAFLQTGQFSLQETEEQIRVLMEILKNTGRLVH